MSVFHAYVLLLTMKFRHDIIKSSLRIHSYFDVMTKFIINNRTDALKTDVNLLNNKVNCYASYFLFMCIAVFHFQVTNDVFLVWTGCIFWFTGRLAYSRGALFISGVGGGARGGYMDWMYFLVYR